MYVCTYPHVLYGTVYPHFHVKINILYVDIVCTYIKMEFSTRNVQTTSPLHTQDCRTRFIFVRSLELLSTLVNPRLFYRVVCDSLSSYGKLHIYANFTSASGKWQKLSPWVVTTRIKFTYCLNCPLLNQCGV